MGKYKLIIYSLIFRIIVDWTYLNSISPLYSYSGLTTNQNLNKYIASYILQILVILCMSKSKRPSNYLYYFFVLFTVTPTLSYYGLNNQSNIYILFFVICSIIVGFIVNFNLKPFKLLKIDAKLLIKVIFYLYLAISFYLFFKRGGIDIRALDFDTVYDLRRESNISGLDGYLINWCAKAFSPFFYAYFSYYKKSIKKVMVISVQLLLYLSFGNKAFLFSIFAVIGINIVMRMKIPEKAFTLSMSVVLIFSDFIDKIFEIDSLRRGIPYRMFFIPSQIQFQYFEFFNNNNKLYFAESFFGKILNLSTGYGIPIPIVISRYFSGNPNSISYSNTGIFSDAYSNMGYFGMFLFALIFGITLIMVDAVSDKIPTYITVSAFSYIIFVVNDTSFLTTFVTGGFGLMLLLLYLMNCELKEEVGR
nr:hypothetical protein [Vagococcus fluvialis]